MSIVKVIKCSSGGGKSDKKRSGKHEHANTTSAAHATANANPYGNSDDEDGHTAGNAANGTFIPFQGKDLSFDDFIEVLNDKHDRDAAVEWLWTSKLKAYNVQQPPITPAMADQLLGGIRAAMGFGAGAGRKGGKKTTTDGVPSESVAATRTTAVACGTALVVCCGNDSKQLFDTWGEVLFSTVTNIIKGLRSQMEEFVHAANTQEGSVKAVIASPAGITSTASAAQRRALSQIAGKCYDLLNKCFESLALLYALDPSMTVNDNHETLPSALLQLANIVIPDYATAPRELTNNFPSAAETSSNNVYLPVEASGSLILCLVSCCEPAQGPKTRAALLRLHRFVTGNTAVEVLGDEEIESSAAESAESGAGDHNSYTGLVHTLIQALTSAIGILASRFPDMVMKVDAEYDSTVTSPTATNVPAFTTVPLLSIEGHLIPLSKILKKRAMGKGKGRREAQALLRQAAKKLGSLNGSDIGSIEEHETYHKKRSNRTGGASVAMSQMTSPTGKAAAAKFPGALSPPLSGTSRTSTADTGDLPMQNPNRAAAAEVTAEEAAHEEYLAATVAHLEALTFDGADPVDVVQFRDKLSVDFIGFQHIYYASCLRVVTADGLQRQLAQNPAVRALFNVTEDLTRKVDRSERKEQLMEAEATKAEERRGRQKERDAKAKFRSACNEDQ